uniref:ShKT domain-containing protein n=1 Tax=Caenorhabditis tropicalis TaxID=1561998 RepID=A0A1I7TTA0_9PELO
MIDRSRHLGILPTSYHIIAILAISISQVLGNGCDRYVKCRNELLEVHWKCAEPSRRFTQHACKINDLYGNHKATAYNIEALFSDCTSKYSAISEIDFLLMTDPQCHSDMEMDFRPSSFSSVTCWSDLMRLTQKCFSLSRCCPAAHRCGTEIEGDVLNEQYELEKSQMKLRLEECAIDMNGVLRAPVSKEDAMIARKVSEATKVMLRSVVPFRVYPDAQKKLILKTRNGKKPREFAAPLSARPRGIKRLNKNRYGISKPKYSSTIRAGRAELRAPIDPPTTSLRPFTVLHHGGTVIQTTSQPPAFSPFTFHSIDFDAKRNSRKLRKNKKRRLRKKKHDFEDEPPLAQASKITESRFDPQHAAEKLDRLNGNLKQKGEYGRSILPKMLMIKQNKGSFLGYAQPVIKPLYPSKQEQVEPNHAVDQIYDDILEAQINENELTNQIEEVQTEKPIHFMPIEQDNTPDMREAFINNNGAWTMEPTTEQTTETPPPSSTIPPPTSILPTTILENFSPRAPSSRITFAPIRRIETTTAMEPTIIEDTTMETTETEPTTTTIMPIKEELITSIPPPTPSVSIDPLVDYITHELLDKHMEKPKSDEDEFDFSNADYIDISAMDIEPSTSTTAVFPIPIARYEHASNSSSIWPMDGPHRPSQPSLTDFTTTPQLRTTAAPLSPGMLSEQQNEDLIPLPTAAHTFGSIDVTASPSISTTPLEDQLWPLPIRKRHRLKDMGAKMMEKTKPIVILPMSKKSAKKMEEYKRKLQTGCQRYDKCLRKEVEMRLRCAQPYPTPYDKCSAQLLPLYRLIDEASNNKLQFFIKCIGDSQDQNAKCYAPKKIVEQEVTCENLDSWSSYCRQLELCCPAKDRCDSEAEVDHVGTRLRLLEKSFSLRAAACQFKHAFHRTLARKM